MQMMEREKDEDGGWKGNKIEEEEEGAVNMIPSIHWTHNSLRRKKERKRNKERKKERETRRRKRKKEENEDEERTGSVSGMLGEENKKYII